MTNLEINEDLVKILNEIFRPDEETAPSDTNFPRWVEADDTFAPFIPTSIARVISALNLAGCTSTDRLLDLGMGDGRFCTTAVSLFSAASAVGIESDATVLSLAQEKLNLTQQYLHSGATFLKNVEFVCADFRNSNCFAARDPTVTILVVFLSPEFGAECKNLLLEHYERGARIVSLVFDLANIRELQLKNGCKDFDGIWVYQKE